MPRRAAAAGCGVHRRRRAAAWRCSKPRWAALRPGGRMVVNAVTIETEAVLLEARARLGGTLTRLAVERLDRIGSLHGFRPAMTVTQWAARKP